MRSLSLALLVFPLALSSANACVLHLRQAGATTLTWDLVDGAKLYEVQESFDTNFATSRNWFVTAPPFTIDHRVSADAHAKYMVTAILGSNILSVGPAADVCTESLSVTLSADPQFRALTRKAIVPIVGSVAGAFGSRFKTSLRLTANGGGQHGRIVFHPIGAIAGDSDPSIPYAFTGAGDSIGFDDVVDYLGRSGLGSLDIVPDDDASSTIPLVDVRLYNDTPGGTFGTSARAVYPFDYLHAPAMTVQIPTGPFRVNLGVRTLTATAAKVLIYDTSMRLRTFVDLVWPADYTILAPVDQILGKSVQPGETLLVYFDGGAIPFYTVTENRTNDPDLVVARPEQTGDVGSYVE